MFDGQSQVALEAARAIPQQVPEAMLREQVDFLDAFMPTDLHVLVRFGRWEEVLRQPEPAEYLPMSRAVWHYARALAYASTDRVDEAEEEREALAEAKELVPETSFLFQNPSLNILGVAEEMVDGEIAYRRGEFKQAFEHLRKSVRRDDALNYDEPWGWMQPARHALGALLAEQGEFAEAERVYREDLRRHPNNPWALHGLSECLAKLGKPAESTKLRDALEVACERSDVGDPTSGSVSRPAVTSNGRSRFALASKSVSTETVPMPCTASKSSSRVMRSAVPGSVPGSVRLKATLPSSAPTPSTTSIPSSPILAAALMLSALMPREPVKVGRAASFPRMKKRSASDLVTRAPVARLPSPSSSSALRPSAYAAREPLIPVTAKGTGFCPPGKVRSSRMNPVSVPSIRKSTRAGPPPTREASSIRVISSPIVVTPSRFTSKGAEPSLS